MFPNNGLPEAEGHVPVPKTVTLAVPMAVSATVIIVEPHRSGEEGGRGRVQRRAPGRRIHETCIGLGESDSTTTLLWAVSHSWLRGALEGGSHL